MEARKELVREIAVGLHVSRGGRASDFDLPSEDRLSVPGGSFIWRWAGIVADRLMANPALLSGLSRLKGISGSALGIQEGDGSGQ